MQTIQSCPQSKPLPEGFQFINHQIICSYDQAPMAYVPAGIFNMGCEDFFASRPVHSVYLSDYFIDIHPVTNEQFKKFWESNGYDDMQYWTDFEWSIRCQEAWEKPRYWGFPPWDHPLHPVVGISWYEANAYARWSHKTLPTEAQWEKAARGGIWLDGDTQHKVPNPIPLRKYPWGNDDPLGFALYQNEPQYGNHSTGPVGLFPQGASPYGCLDMSGNVWEWCQDFYNREYYKTSRTENPPGYAGQNGDAKILRGGSWCRDARQLHVSFRTKDDPINGGWDLSGFRCVKLLP